MRRKPPKSHAYTIISLSVTILAVGAYLGYIYSGSNEHEHTEHQPVVNTQEAIIELNDTRGMSQLTPGAGSNINVQNAEPGVQAAAGSDIYSQYDQQKQSNYQPQNPN